MRAARAIGPLFSPAVYFNGRMPLPCLPDDNGLGELELDAANIPPSYHNRKGTSTMARDKSITAGEIRAFVEESMESTKAQEVLAWLKGHVGKPITTRLADAANKAFPGEDFRLDRRYGMTYLENGSYRTIRYRQRDDEETRKLYKTSINILLAHSEGAVPLQEVYLTEHNTCYTKDADERNALRAKSLKGDWCEQMATAYNELIAAQAKIEALTGYGKPFSPDSSGLEKAFLKERR